MSAALRIWDEPSAAHHGAFSTIQHNKKQSTIAHSHDRISYTGPVPIIERLLLPSAVFSDVPNHTDLGVGWRRCIARHSRFATAGVHE